MPVVKPTMNFEKVQRKNRKAISPVLATVILIAITLIAAIAIAGFVFGLFGSFTSSAQVSAAVTSCTQPGGAGHALVCTLTLTNTGTSNVAVSGCSIQVAGTAQASTPLGGNVPAGGNLPAQTCTTTSVALTEPALGSQAVGAFTLSNGASVPFSGVWS